MYLGISQTAPRPGEAYGDQLRREAIERRGRISAAKVKTKEDTLTETIAALTKENNELKQKLRDSNQKIEDTEFIIDSLMNVVRPRPSETVTMDAIIDALSEESGISRATMVSSKRISGDYRHVGYYLARKWTPRSLPQISRAFGRSDHSTALYGIRKVSDNLPQYSKLIDVIEKRLGL